ncbi:hypothetical protein BH23ACT12_BH23ACT12_16800 [soil metagenome]
MALPAGALTGIDKSAVASRFNRSAGTYDEHCRVQRLMAGRLAARLETMSEPTRILELGCGTGFLTRLLAARFPRAGIQAVDFAARMVDLAGQRVPSRVDLRVADAETAEFPRAGFDLIVSNAAVQWFDSPGETLARLAGCLRPGGMMVHSTFGPGTFTELRMVLGKAGAQGAGLPLRSAGEWAALLEGCGLCRVAGSARREVVRYPGAAGFLTELHSTGATWRPYGGESAPLGPGQLRRVLDRYDAELGTPEGVPVTYELVEISGHRPGRST